MSFNRKGYMLIEIILASALAFGIAYFILDLTLGMKTKNDDLLVETLVNTDRTIITNKLMEYAMAEKEKFNCDELKASGNTILYVEETVDIINNYAEVKIPEFDENGEKIDNGKIPCKNDLSKGKITIKIPLDVKQMPDSDFDINIDYKYRIGDTVKPTCSLTIKDNKIVFKTKDDNISVTSYDINTSVDAKYDNNDSLDIGLNTFYGHVMDAAKNEGSCTIKVISTDAKPCNCRTCTGDCISWGSQVCSCNVSSYHTQHACELGGFRWSCASSCLQYYTWTCCSSTCYSCSSGYTKLNDTYCYKVG